MNEMQRMQYLSALDVDCYMPRFILTNAPVILPCEKSYVAEHSVVTAIETPELKNTPAVSKQTASAPSAESIKAAADVLRTLGLESSTKSEKVKPQSVEVTDLKSEVPVATKIKPSAESSLEIASFSLALWCVGEMLFLDSRDIDISLPTDRFIHNIVSALGYSHRDISSFEIINWPFTALAIADKTESYARVDIQAFLDGKLLTSPVKKLILLGENANKFILPQGIDYQSQVNQPLKLADFAVDAVVSFSLSEMLLKPELKQSFWMAICDCHKSL